MSSALLLPADSLTQPVPEEEQYWFSTESEPEDTTEQPKPGQIPSYREHSARPASPSTFTSDELAEESVPSGTLVSEHMTYSDFADDYATDPAKAVEKLESFVDLRLITKAKATEWLFPLLVEARGALKEVIYKMLLILEEPETILRIALSEYTKYGKEERLTLAAALLADLGACALPSLRSLARANLPECELFVPVIAYLSNVSMHDRLETLANLVSNPSPDVRDSVLWALRVFPPPDVKPLLRRLSQDLDEAIADEAQARLESLEA